MSTETRFVLCIANEGHPASLELRKVYRVVGDRAAERDGLLRIIDETGEDYLYPRDLFVSIDVPERAERAFADSAP